MEEEKKNEIGFIVTDKYAPMKQPVIFSRKFFSNRAVWAKEMVERWGMVAAIEDGEDSAGRAKLRLATEQEVVARACKCAEMLYEECEKRGWCIDIPDPVAGKDV